MAPRACVNGAVSASSMRSGDIGDTGDTNFRSFILGSSYGGKPGKPITYRTYVTQPRGRHDDGGRHRASLCPMKTGDPLPKNRRLPGSVHQEWKRCGRPTCRCARGEPHGPYTYRHWREDGRQRKRYVRQTDVTAVRAACEAERAERQRARRERATAIAHWQSLRDVVREAERHE